MIARRLGTGVALARLSALLTLFSVLKHLVPLPTLARWSWRPSNEHERHEPPSRRTGYVLRAAQLVRTTERNCLQRSLVLYRELSRLGCDPALVIGFGFERQRLAGHAWVTVNDRIVGDDPTDVARFAPVCTFGRSGVMRPFPVASSSA